LRDEKFCGSNADLLSSSAGQCGNCWDVAGLAVYESAGVRAQFWDRTKQFSAQHLLDCVVGPSMNGCRGGPPNSALEWLTKNHPATAGVYPYKGVQGKCRSGTVAQGWNGPLLETQSYLFNRYPHDPNNWSITEESLLDALQKYGPLLVAVDASSQEHRQAIADGIAAAVWLFASSFVGRCFLFVRAPHLSHAHNAVLLLLS
jgi:hypothetical protein